MRTYNVILKKGVDYQSFWDDMENENDGGNLYIPNRRVDSPNLRPGSKRQTWYTLSDEEAETVRNDERVLTVEIPPEDRDDIMMVSNFTQSGSYTKTTSDSGEFINWGLIRHKSQENNYGTDSTTNENYLYTLDGDGVDVVIQDSGIQVDHPEFNDRNNVGRVVELDWDDESGLSFTQDANHYRDLDGHGTHVAGIVAGKTYGWAKEARIYAQKLSGLEGTGDSGTGISTTYAFDAIKIWHSNKPINPKTGYPRPTVVNMSWGYLTGYDTVTEVNYRGVSYTGTDIDTTTKRNNNYGVITNSYPTIDFDYAANTRVSSVDADIEEMIDEGIVVVVAAGNRGFKIDVADGDGDYDNYIVTNNGTKYYHRGSSPFGDTEIGGETAIQVGNMDSSVSSSLEDQKATSSETGPGVDVYAAGTNIMSCTSNTNKFTDAAYYLDSNYRQCNIGGTSMAAPQVAGYAALLLQQNPGATPAQIKQWIIDSAGTTINKGAGNDDWTNRRSLVGGKKKVMYNKFKGSKSFSMQNVGDINFNINLKNIND